MLKTKSSTYEINIGDEENKIKKTSGEFQQ